MTGTADKPESQGGKLIQLLRLEGPQLTAEFRKASISGRSTPQEISDRREEALRQFFGRYFPFPYRVAKGNIVDSFGLESDSIDCIVLHPTHPYTVDVGPNNFSAILADGVFAAIELKPDIQDTRELFRGLEQIRSVKGLRRARSPLIEIPVGPPLDPVYQEESRRTPAVIFAETAKSDPIDTVVDVLQYYAQHQVPIHEQVDFVVINGVGILANVKHPQFSPWGAAAATYWESTGDETLAALLYHLNSDIVPPEPRLGWPFLISYLGGLRMSVARVTAEKVVVPMDFRGMCRTYQTFDPRLVL